MTAARQIAVAGAAEGALDEAVLQRLLHEVGVVGRHGLWSAGYCDAAAGAGSMGHQESLTVATRSISGFATP